MSLKPVNAALCPYCSSKKTARGGYNKNKKASMWKCLSCEKAFFLKSLVLFSSAT